MAQSLTPPNGTYCSVQPDSGRAPPANPGFGTYYLYQYFDVDVYYAAGYQVDFGQAPGDGSFDYYELRLAVDNSVEYTSGTVATSATAVPSVRTFSAVGGVVAQDGLEMWVCMTPSGICHLAYPDVAFCPSAYSPFPAGCAFNFQGPLNGTAVCYPTVEAIVSPTPTPTVSASASASNSPSATVSPSATASVGSPSSVTPTPSISPTANSTPSQTNTITSTQSPTATQTPSMTLSTGATPSTTATVSSTPSISIQPSATPSSLPGFTRAECLSFGCEATANGTCNALVGCTTFPLDCIYAEQDGLCPAVPSDGCFDYVCDTAATTAPSGCIKVSHAAGTPCTSSRPCHTNGICNNNRMCMTYADDTLCSLADASQCAWRRCVRDLHDTRSDIDAQGCRMTARFTEEGTNTCIHGDPCIVSTPNHPTYCEDMSFLCVGGEEVACEEGARCVLGACVLIDCDGDDDDCYRPDDDDDDDGGNGLDDWDDWKAPLILAAALLCCCCLLLLLVATRRDRQKRE